MSTLKADTIVAADGTSPVTLTKQSAAKAFIDYNQATDVVNSSFNISGTVDNTTGDFTSSFTSSFDDAFYPIATFSAETSVTASNRVFGAPTRATGSIRATVGYVSSTGGQITVWDNQINDITIHGDLA
tara:strand:- start:746 stop:1132 length:387 start_codon:yes stop_codon:yes gene_type:complete